MIKVCLINTYQNYGGAALACQRLLKALNQTAEVEARLLVQEMNQVQTQTSAWAESYLAKKLAFYRFIRERLSFYYLEKEKSLRFAFSPASFGVDISTHPWVREADVLHLHWINFGFLSLQSLKKLFSLNKPVVITLHDMWFFTGGCHYAGNCKAFEKQCGNCPFFLKPRLKDLSFRILQKKKALYKSNKLTFVACSQWMANIANESSLLKENQLHCQAIPNPIDTALFLPLDKTKSRISLKLPEDKFLILFGAMNSNDPRKGFNHLLGALKQVHQQHPEWQENIILLVFGKNKENLKNLLPYTTYTLGQVTQPEKLIEVYNAADIFVLPSLEDNLPNTVMEAMSCGRPVLAFETGGVPEMINHLENGYLAGNQSPNELAKGLIYFFTHKDQLAVLGKEAREKVSKHFSEDLIAKQYLQVYNQAMKP